MKVKILLSLILVVLLSVSATAALLIDHDPGGYTVWGAPDGEKQIQSFTTLSDTYFITGFGYKHWDYQPAEQPKINQYDLREWVAGPTLMDTGTLLGSKIGMWASPGDGVFLEVTFDSPIPVLPDTLYSMCITNIDGMAGYYRETDAGGGTYPGGANFRMNNAGPPESWGQYTDLAFRIYGDVPEPATIALLGLGALALLRKRS